MSGWFDRHENDPCALTRRASCMRSRATISSFCIVPPKPYDGANDRLELTATPAARLPPRRSGSDEGEADELHELGRRHHRERVVGEQRDVFRHEVMQEDRRVLVEAVEGGELAIHQERAVVRRVEPRLPAAVAG